MDPLSIAGLVGGVASGVFGGLGANEQAQATKAGVRLQRDQFRNEIGRQMATSPLRDRAIAQLLQRMGYAPSPFRYESLTQGPRGAQPNLEGMWKPFAPGPNSGPMLEELYGKGR